MTKRKKILILAAHPDDEVLGCGGTIAKFAKEGHDVFISIIGEGVTSRYADRQDADQTLVKELQAKSHQVGGILGAKKVTCHDLPDNRFDTIPLLDVVKLVENIIDDLAPEIIFTQHGGDLNVDHAITFRAAMTATRPLPGCQVKELYTFETLSSTEWAFNEFKPSFQPNLFVDISETLALKIQAMEKYESESREFPHPRSSEALRNLALRWGSAAGLEAAEAFQLIRKIQH